MKKQSRYVLPKGMLVNEGKKQDTFYYRGYINGVRKKVPLGHDYQEALRLFRQYETIGTTKAKTLSDVWNGYRQSKKGLLKLRERTQKDYEGYWNILSEKLGNIPIDKIEPHNIVQYLDKYHAPVQANRHIALVSRLFNFALNHHGFKGANPCFKIERNEETGRDKYVEKSEYEQIYAHASDNLKNFLDLLLFTGQRVDDVLKFQMSNIKRNIDLSTIFMANQMLASDVCGQSHADILYCGNSKTGHPINLLIVGRLKEIIDRIMAYRKTKKVTSIYLTPNHKGGELSYYTVEKQYSKARAKAGFGPYSIQMRDLRAKNASDDTLENATVRLAHTNVAMTEKYRDNVRDKFAMPLMKII